MTICAAALERPTVRKDIGSIRLNATLLCQPWVVTVPNQDFIVQEGNLRYFAATQTRILVETSLGQHKTCQIRFWKDGSIYVECPYFKGGSRGILSRVELDPRRIGPQTVDLKQNGRVVSSLVKFSHKTSGRTHFSQDTKIFTKMVRQSWPLNGPIGQVFQLNIYHLRGLDLLKRADIKPTRLFLPFRFVNGLPFAVTIAGEWRRKHAIVANLDPPDGIAGPAPIIQSRRTGEEMQVFFLGQPDGFPLRDHLLVLRCGAIPLLGGVDDPLMLLLGGWDLHEALEGGQSVQNTGFLAWLYPAKNYDHLKDTIGSLDYDPKFTL